MMWVGRDSAEAGHSVLYRWCSFCRLSGKNGMYLRNGSMLLLCSLVCLIIKNFRFPNPGLDIRYMVFPNMLFIGRLI